jgi:hypothetical protein
LTQSIGDAVDQKDGTQTINEFERYSEFLSDSTIRVTDLKTVIDKYEKEDQITTTDSLSID